MTNRNELSDISAEYLLNYLYPELEDSWKVDCAGTFYRNYSPDILSVDTANRTVRLARDSFFHLLPQGMIAGENSLKGAGFEQNYESIKKREELLKDLFKPVDTLGFRFRLHIENVAARLSSDKISLILERYFGIDLQKEENPYIRKTAPLLLFISRLRADFSFLRNLMEQLFGCEVRMKTGRYTWEEDDACSQPAVNYEIIMPGLTAESYRKTDETIDPFREFICEWFIPFDTRCSILLKAPYRQVVIGDDLLLDYNTGPVPETSDR